jgi:hypothetical protein
MHLTDSPHTALTPVEVQPGPLSYTTPGSYFQQLSYPTRISPSPFLFWQAQSIFRSPRQETIRNWILWLRLELDRDRP